jgi:hypothetical protein
MSDQAQIDSGVHSPSLSEDPIFSAVHDAFQLGWSIIELKSRIQIAALSTSITSSPRAESTAGASSAPSTATPASITGSPRAESTAGATNSSQGQASQLMQNVLSTLSAAKTKLLLPESQQNLTELPDNAWLTSLWRATFNRIVESHKGCFPVSTTTGTLYNLPPHSNTLSYQALVANPQTYDASTMYLPYLYLYPDNELDYANVGIQHQQDDQLTGYTLYDVARRAINCLTLLYTDPNESLIPNTVSDFQRQLVQNVTNFHKLAAIVNNTTQSGQPQGDPTTLNQPTTPQGDSVPSGQPGTDKGDSTALPFDQQRTNAIQLLSIQSVRFLETWDTYARETLYVSGGEEVQANEIQLVAYEAGRALASLSWGITTTIVPIENALNQTLNTDPSTSQDAKNDPGLQQHLEGAWLKIFDDRSIASIQQQISALSTAMDDAFYIVHPNIQRPNPNDPEERTNLALPSQTIQAVTFSLDYWKRAVQLICNQQPDTNTGTPSPGETAKPVANSTPSPSGGVPKPVAIPSMNWQTSSNLRLTLVQQAEIWQPLLLHQQSLLDFTTQYVTQRILNDFMSEFEQAAGQEIQNEIRKFRTPLIIGGGVILLLLVSLVLLFIFAQGSYQALVSGFALVVGGIVGFFGTVVARFRSVLSPSSSGASTAQGSASSISAIPGLAGAALVEAFQNGYKQILIEFDYLNHNVSITYPLVEFFILHSDQLAKKIKAGNAQVDSTNWNSISQRIVSLIPGKNKESLNKKPANEVTTEVVYLIKDAYDFLTKIVWTNQDRADEIGRIARAAFGPIGAFIGAQLSISSAQNKKSSASKK